MELRLGYKMTEVGIIPEDWDVKPFQSLANIERGKFTARPRNDPKYYGGEIPFIQTGDVTNSNGRITTYSQTLNREGLKVSKLFPRGTLFFTIAANIGDVGFASFDTACPDSLVAISPVKRIDKRWLAHELRRRKLSFENLASHNAQLNINLEKLRPYLLPVPPQAEQEAIAEAISDADALIESLEQLIAKKRQIKQGAMQELLSGKKRLTGFKGEWGERPLKEFVRRFIVPMRDKPKRFTGNIPWCRIEDFNGMYLTGSRSGQHVDAETITSMNLKVYPAGTLLVSCSADLGRCAIVAQPLVSNQTFIGLEMDEAVSSNLFFYYFMTFRAGTLNNLSSGTTISYLSREQFEEFVVSAPLDKQEQSSIATILYDLDSEIRALGEKLSKARQLKQGMMQELLTGRIRLK